ncbi:MAG: SEC-C metal-binding domain-containing protein [Candidatus Buchananbacteria bacterium]
MTKVGRNDPCSCGSGKKYKKCCLAKDERRAQLEERVKHITRADFISGPYKTCPKCGKETFGVFVGTGGNGYSRECTTCWHQQGFSLPEIKKKIIYLDQFLISNMTKALDKTARSHEKVIAQPFWLEAYKKLDRLLMLNLVVCPDSTFHTDESLLSGDPPYKSLKKVYERLSSGCTFYDHHTILRFQVQEHFENYLNDVPDKPLELKVDNIVHGRLHEWLGRMRVSVNMRPYDGQLEAVHKERNSQYEAMKSVFQRWQQERGRNFMEWVNEEAYAFGKGTVLAHLKFLKKQAALPQKYADQYLQGKEPDIDLNDIFPPPSSELIQALIRTLRGRGIDGEDAIKKAIEYLSSKYVTEIPSVRISSLLYAGIARKASSGQKEPPNKGTFTDVNAIANLLPYCDAIFIDNGMAALLQEEPIKTDMSRYPVKVFSPNTKSEFFQYLDSIEQAADPSHLEITRDAYGEDWAKPHLTILDKNELDDDE